MKLVVPLTEVDYFLPLVDAGADEFYCGYLPYEWLKNYSNCSPINRRECLSKYNITTFESMKILASLMHKMNIPVSIAFNSHFYLKEQYSYIADLIKQLMSLGFYDYIVADIALIIYLHNCEIKCQIHLSGDATPLNSLIVPMMDELGISRIIFPRETTITEMQRYIESTPHKKVAYEAFVLNSFCFYDSMFCNSVHTDEMIEHCMHPYRLARIKSAGSTQFSELDARIFIKRYLAERYELNKTTNEDFAKTGCGLCKIKALEEVGITHLKIVGRGYNMPRIVRDIKLMKMIMSKIDMYVQIGLDGADVEAAIINDLFEGTCPKLCLYNGI